MVIRQPAALNRFVDKTIPWNWEKRKERLRMVLPVLVFGLLLFGENVLFAGWASGRSLAQAALVPMGAMLFYVALILCLLEVGILAGHRKDRVLTLEPKRVGITHTKYPKLPWRRVREWRLAPVVEDPSLTKLTLGYSVSALSKQLRYYSIILGGPDVAQTVRQQLESFTGAGVNTAPILIETTLRAADTPERAGRGSSDGWMGQVRVFLGLFLVVHALPLLFVGLLGAGNAGSPAGRNGDGAVSGRYHAARREQVQRAIVAVFGSGSATRLNMGYTGGVLAVLGLGLIVWPGNFRRDKAPPDPLAGRV